MVAVAFAQLSEPIKLVIRFCNCCCNYSLGTGKGIIKYGDFTDFFFSHLKATSSTSVCRVKFILLEPVSGLCMTRVL